MQPAVACCSARSAVAHNGWGEPLCNKKQGGARRIAELRENFEEPLRSSPERFANMVRLHSPPSFSALRLASCRPDRATSQHAHTSFHVSTSQGDEEGESGPVYLYEGDRATGATMEITAGAPPKELTKELQLLGVREGQGKATFPQGDVYEGTFSEGVRGGAGKYTYAAPPPGEDEEPKPPVGEYGGAWKAGQKNGVGVMTYSSGAKYHGHWKSGKYEGNGTLFYPNGDIYTGMWAAGKKHGQGTYIFKATDTKVSGEFSHNVLQSGSFTDAYGNEFAGQFSGSAESVGYVAGGEYKLCSGATQVRARERYFECV